MSVIPFLDIRWFLFHPRLDFFSTLGAGVWREFLVELSIEVMLVLDHEVLENPHVALVDEAIHGDKHVRVDRVSHLFDLVRVASRGALVVTFSLCEAHLRLILSSHGLFLLQESHISLKLWLRLIAEID